MPPRLLVVYKKSQLALYQEREPSALVSIQASDPGIYARFLEAHDENERAIEQVTRATERLGLNAEFVYRAELAAGPNYDIIVAVGGDGTLLDVSHNVTSRPLLGLNSSRFSVGHFCAARVADAGETFQSLLACTLKETTLTRIQARINGQPHATPVLNEALYAAVVPAAVSRYVLTVDGAQETHKSSGIWISTAAGSSAAIRSAGGTLMAPEDRRLQYRVREPYLWANPNLELLSGVVAPPLHILSETRQAALYLDGHRVQIPLRLGDTVEFHAHPHPLRLLGFQRSHR